MTRRFTQSDTILREIDRALRISTGATGRPTGTASGGSDETDASRALRESHAALTITAGLQAGTALTGQAPSAQRQSRQTMGNTDRALTLITNAMNQTDARPSLLAPALYLASVTTGAVTAMAGERETRALHADNRRRISRALDSTADRKSKIPPMQDDGSVSEQAIAAAKVAIENRSHPDAPHSAYEPRMSSPVKKLFDIAETTISRLSRRF